MSLPTDLRVLCFQLSMTAAQDLPGLLPTLLQRLTRCQLHLSNPAGSSSRSDESASSVLVHKLKTQLHTLFKGQSLEGRFAAVALTKTVIEVGGWEVLQGPELRNWWIPGLLSILVKPDSSAAKELCILTLTKIYCLTSQYQTLVREVTSPTLPTFLTSCLNLIAPKSTVKRMEVSLSLTEVVFRAFAVLLPRNPTLFRPEASRIRLAARPYLAPTCSDSFVPTSLQESARQIVALTHLSAVKNSGGEEWGKAVKSTIQRIHMTSDQVFRAVIEDWESTAGYMSEAIEIGRDLAGGSNEADDLPPWNGIHAGVDRLTGLLAILEEHIRTETFAPVSMPLGAIMDMTTRILSVFAPCSSDTSGDLRLHPAVDRDEREGLWSGLPQIHAASLQLVEAVADRLQDGFIPLAGGALEQLAWIFPHGKSDLPFRCRTYYLARKLLLLIGKSLDRRQTSKLVPIIRVCCQDLIPSDQYPAGSGMLLGSSTKEPNTQNLSGTTSKEARNLSSEDSSIKITTAAGELLPLLVSHVPQKHLDIPIRSLIERTAILAHHSATLLACIMTPFIGKDGRAISSIMPYAARGLVDESTLELLLRPRMPLLPAASGHVSVRESTDLELEEDDIAMQQDIPETKYDSYRDTQTHLPPATEDPDLVNSSKHFGFGNTRNSESPREQSGFSLVTADHAPPSFMPISSSSVSVSSRPSGGAREDTRRYMEPSRQMDRDAIMDEESPDSSDESVHLTMELDTDPED